MPIDYTYFMNFWKNIQSYFFCFFKDLCKIHIKEKTANLRMK